MVGAAPFAALPAGRVNLPPRTRTACILSGGNVDLSSAAGWFT